MVRLFLFVTLTFISAAQERRYTDTKNKFTIDYPDSWTQKDNGNVAYFLSPLEPGGDRFSENVNVMLQDLAQQPLTLEEYTDLTKKQILEHVGPDAILSTKSVTFAGFPAVEMIYKMTPTGYDLKLRQYWFIKDKTAFLFTYTAEKLQYDRYEEAALKTIHSFKLIQ